MRYPCLIQKSVCKTPIFGSVEQEGYGTFGAPLEPISFSAMCNYQDRAKTVLTAEKKIVEVKGTALIPGDICPNLPTISGGTVNLYGVERCIALGTKARNPDGTVNYTRLEII